MIAPTVSIIIFVDGPALVVRYGLVWILGPGVVPLLLQSPLTSCSSCCCY
jgi:hypothetical protein